MGARDVLLATRNDHKLVEIRDLLQDVPIRIVSPDDVGIPPDPGEDGVERWETFEANALAKAAWFRERSGLPTLADDSGLCVDALHGAPGVWSRRFAPDEEIGPEGRDTANNRHLLRLLRGRPPAERSAHYRCALALIAETFQVVVFGRCDGSIATETRGGGGFGYDPLFVVPGLGDTFGELPPAVKAERSHRAAAVRGMRPWLAPMCAAPGDTIVMRSDGGSR
ncbi:MAG: non-canonical purine NTP pyrophosphatase [Gemmatimonadota bacterium]